MNELEKTNLESDFTQSKFYTVKNGDTIYSIAKKFFGDTEEYKKIMDLNSLTNSRIFVGQTLRLPESLNSDIILYKVKAGDTLWSISEKILGYGPKYNDIMILNNLTSDVIYPGQILKISINEIVSPEVYIVKPKDTLWKIAKETLDDGRRYKEIMKLNNLNSEDIRVGQRLILPEK